MVNEVKDLFNEITAISKEVENKVEKNTAGAEINALSTKTIFLENNGDLLDLLNLVSSKKDGRMSKEDKIKLDGIEVGANNYVHPSTHPATMIVQDSSHRFVSDAMIASWNDKLDKSTGGTVKGLVRFEYSFDPATNTGISVNNTHSTVNSSLIGFEYNGNERKYAIGVENGNPVFKHWDSNSGSFKTGELFRSDKHFSVPNPEVADDTRYLRNDNTWQTITPEKISALTKNDGVFNYMDPKIQRKGLSLKYLRLDLGEGLDFIDSEHYFGTNQDARIMRIIDGNDDRLDGGFVIQAFIPSTNTSEELLRIRQYNNEFKYKGHDIYHTGNFNPGNFLPRYSYGNSVGMENGGMFLGVGGNNEINLRTTGESANGTIHFNFRHLDPKTPKINRIYFEAGSSDSSDRSDVFVGGLHSNKESTFKGVLRSFDRTIIDFSLESNNLLSLSKNYMNFSENNIYKDSKNTSSVKGALILEYPVEHFSSTMAKFKLDIHSYNVGSSVSFDISCDIGGTSDEWYKSTVIQYGGKERIPVSFGRRKESLIPVIVIGTVDTIWYYPLVMIRDIMTRSEINMETIFNKRIIVGFVSNIDDIEYGENSASKDVTRWVVDSERYIPLPTPEKADNAKFLRNDNTWQKVTPENIGAYTKGEVDAKLSQLETKIDWKESVNTFEDIAETYPNPEDGWTVNVKDTDYTYRYSGTEWVAISANAIPNATHDKDGKMSKEDKKKLDGIEAGANNYKHPASHDASMINTSSDRMFVTQAQIDSWNNKADGNSNVASAGKWTTPRKVTFTGGATGSFSIDGSSDVSTSLTVADNSHNHLWSNITDKPSTFPPSAHGNHVPNVQPVNNATFLRNDNTWYKLVPGDIGAYTKDEVNNIIESNSKLTLEKTLSGRGYATTVIKLFELTNAGHVDADKFFTGDMYFRRSNGLYTPTRASIIMSKRWNQEKPNVSIVIQGYRPHVFNACTFTHEGKKYAGIEFKSADATWHNLNIVGAWSTDVDFTCIDYKEQAPDQPEKSLNDEIYNSIQRDNGEILDEESVFLVNNYNVVLENTDLFLRKEKVLDDRMIGFSANDAGVYIGGGNEMNFKSTTDFMLFNYRTVAGSKKINTIIFGDGSGNGNGLSNIKVKNIEAKGGTISGDNLSLFGSNLNMNNGDIKIETDNRILFARNSDSMTIGFKNDSDQDTDSYGYIEMADNGIEYFKVRFKSTESTGGQITDVLKVKLDGAFIFDNEIYHAGNCKVLPPLESANNSRFLRNDNTWQTVTPENIGALPSKNPKINIIDNKYYLDRGDYGINMHNSDLIGLNNILYADVSDTRTENVIGWPKIDEPGNDVKNFDTLRGPGDGRLLWNEKELALKENVVEIYRSSVIVKGDPNTYYPVHARITSLGNNDTTKNYRVSCYRTYGEQASPEWSGSSTHMGGLFLDINLYLRGWDGMCYKVDVEIGQTYSTMVADVGLMSPATNTLVLLLRGGGENGALYHFESELDLKFEVTLGRFTNDRGGDDGHQYINYVDPTTEPKGIFKDLTKSIRKGEGYNNGGSSFRFFSNRLYYVPTYEILSENVKSRNYYPYALLNTNNTNEGNMIIKGDYTSRATDDNKHSGFYILNKTGSLIGGYYLEESEDISIKNYKSKSLITLKTDGTTVINSSDLQTSSKDVVGAINELKKSFGSASFDWLKNHGFEDINNAGGSGVNFRYAHSTSQKPSGSQDGPVMTLAYDESWYYQMYGDWRTGDLYLRGSNKNPTNPLSWKKVWHSDNFNPTTKMGFDGGKMTGSIRFDHSNFTTNKEQFVGWRHAAPDLNSRFIKTQMGWSYTGTEDITKIVNKFPSESNANGILTFNTHEGDYGHQIGLSGNGNIYHRNIQSGSISGWHTIWSSKNFNPANYLTMESGENGRMKGFGFGNGKAKILLRDDNEINFAATSGNLLFNYRQIDNVKITDFYFGNGGEGDGQDKGTIHAGKVVSSSIETSVVTTSGGLRLPYESREVRGAGRLNMGDNHSTITTAQFIDLLYSKGAFNNGGYGWMTRGSWWYDGNQTISDSGCGPVQLAGSWIEVIGVPGQLTIRVTTPTTSAYGGENSEYIYIDNGGDYKPGWRKLWNNTNFNPDTKWTRTQFDSKGYGIQEGPCGIGVGATNEISFKSGNPRIWFNYAHVGGERITDFYFGNGTNGGYGNIHCNSIRTSDHIYIGNGKCLVTAHNYGIMGNDSGGSSRYMMFMDTNNRIHIGYNKERDVEFDASTVRSNARIENYNEDGSFMFSAQHQCTAPFYHSFNNGGSSDYHPIIKQRYHIPGITYGRWSLGTLCNGGSEAPFVVHHIHEDGHGGNTFYKFRIDGTFESSKVINAVWNDYAEYFPKTSDTITEPGDVIALRYDVDEDKELYGLGTKENYTVVGVHSDEYGHLIGGDPIPEDYEGTFEEYNADKYIPVGLVGRVRAKITGPIKRGQKVVLSDIPGVGRAYIKGEDDFEDVFGVAVESKSSEGIERVKIVIK